MIEILNRAADNLCSEGWDEEAAAVRKVADHIEELEKFKSIHAKCDEVSLELEQKLILQLAGCHRENERLRAALGKEETKQFTPGYEHMTPETVQAIRDTCSTPASRVGKTQSEVFKEEDTP